MNAPTDEYFPAKRYEALRRVPLEAATALTHPRGLGVLIGHGMAAWMRAWASCPVPRLPEPREREPQQAARPDVVAVLTQMALAAARQEVSL